MARAWDPPATVVAAGRGDPILEDVDVRPSGDAVAAWIARPGTTELWASRYLDGEWDAGVPLHRTPDEVLFARLANDGQGTIFAVYQVVTYPFGYQEVTTWAREFVGESWSDPTRLGGGSPLVGGLTVAASRDGSAIAAWVVSTWAVYELWAARYVPGAGWSAEEGVGIGGGQMDLAMDEAGRAVLAWTRYDEGFRGVWVSRFEASQGWSLPEQIDAGSTQVVDVAMTQGRALAVWTRMGNQGLRVWWSVGEPSTGWSAPERLAFGPSIDSVWIGGAGVEVATNREGSGVAVFQFSETANTSLWAADLVNLAWGRPYRLANGAFAHVAVNSRGDAAIAWLNPGGIVVRTRTVSGIWCPARLATEGELIADSKVVVGEAGEVLAVWTERAAGGFEIRFSRDDATQGCASAAPGIVPLVSLGLLATSGVVAAAVALGLRGRKSGRKEA